MWNVNDIADEIAGVSCLLLSRRQTSKHASVEKEKALVENCVKKIEAMQSLTSQDAATLFTKVGQTSLSEDMKQLICDGIDAAMTKASNHGPAAAMTKPQTLTTVNNYLTEEDWQALAGDWSLSAKAGILVKRLRALGVRSCSEATTRYCVALLLALLPPHAFPAYDVVFAFVHDFKKLFASSKECTHAPWLQKFPEFPSQLPEGHLAAAYQKQQPCPKDIDKLAAIAEHHVPMRKTSKLLAQSQKATLGSHPKGGHHQVGQPAIQPNQQSCDFGSMGHLLQVLAAALPAMLPQGQSKGTTITVSPKKQLALPNGGSSAGAQSVTEQKALELPATEVKAVPALNRKRKIQLVENEAEGGAEEGQENNVDAKKVAMTSTDYEQAAFEALKGKKDKKSEPSSKQASTKKAAAPKKKPKKQAQKESCATMYKVERYKSSIGIRRKYGDKKQIGSLRPQAKSYEKVLQYAESLCAHLSVAIQGKSEQKVKEIELNTMEGAYNENM